MEDNEIREILLHVAEMRSIAADFDRKYQQHMQRFEEEIRPLIDARDEAKAELRRAEGLARLRAREMFLDAGERKLPFGMAIRRVTEVEYDPVEALAWCRARGLCLQLDKKAFESIIRAMPEDQRPDFVTVKRNPIATIPGKIDADGLHAALQSE